MKYCHRCHRATTGAPLYCNFCGCSYDVKLCPRQHINPRSAQACSQCGSPDLSTPQPKIPLLARPLFWLLGVAPGAVLLLALLVFLGYYLDQLVKDPNALLPLMLLGLLLGILMWLWMMLPTFLKRLLKGLFFSSSKDRGAKNH